MEGTEAPIVRFGVFELDRASAELRRAGRKVHLPPQATRLLILLTDRAGVLVTRDDIRAALWDPHTFVDVDTAVNACISQIRHALNDSATAPRFIETVPRRGYRFVGEVATATPVARTFMVREASAEGSSQTSGLRRGFLAAAALLTLLIAALAWVTFAGSRVSRVAPTQSDRAWALEAMAKYERGHSGLADASPAELLDRVKHFERAIELEPEFAAAYAGLADARLIIATYRADAPQVAYAAAKAAASRAIALDPASAEGHAAYGAATLYFDWNWTAAREHLELAARLDAASSRVHHWFSRYLTAAGLHRLAMQHALQAAALAPGSPSAATNAGITEFYANDIRRSREWCGRGASLMREFVPARLCLDATSTAAAAGAPGLPDAVLLPAVDLASAGRNGEALEWLEQAANRHADAMVFVRVQPAFAALRDNPRMRNVIARVGGPDRR